MAEPITSPPGTCLQCDGYLYFDNHAKWCCLNCGLPQEGQQGLYDRARAASPQALDRIYSDNDPRTQAEASNLANSIKPWTPPVENEPAPVTQFYVKTSQSAGAKHTAGAMGGHTGKKR